MEYLFYSVVALCVTFAGLFVFDDLSLRRNSTVKEDVKKKDTELEYLANTQKAFNKDLEDVKKRVDVLTLKAGFKL